MSIQAYIENIRSKPEHIRRRVAFWSSFGISAIIFAFWLTSFTMTIAGPKDTALANQARTPGQSLIAGVGGIFTDVRDLIFKPKKIVYTGIQVSPGK